MPDETPPRSSILLYQTEDGRTRVQCRFENETLWLTQALIAELYQKDVRTISEHLANIFDEAELDKLATIRKFRIVDADFEQAADAVKKLAQSKKPRKGDAPQAPP